MAARKKTAQGHDKFIEEFNGNPDEKNWELFKKRIKKDKARYYYVVYPKSVKEKLSLMDAYAVIYDGKHRQLYKIPVIKKGKKGIEGATIYLKELDINRKAI